MHDKNWASGNTLAGQTDRPDRPGFNGVSSVSEDRKLSIYPHVNLKHSIYGMDEVSNALIQLYDRIVDLPQTARPAAQDAPVSLNSLREVLLNGAPALEECRNHQLALINEINSVLFE